eukprot:gnl/TRDRNA2_/TRDRNA2_143235_c0_seq1.p1 gnl/TRDRNA2_/TRDRNA2_143235_c0~~gnl/TRDRNA2_/TRDRNA2_143235_c0_seq1.p1  ORF type:complete len:223 (-),score=21.31 gnl/TRDRNA2_/TRDRNA2_143235_c0_seq1:113-781(-)
MPAQTTSKWALADLWPMVSRQAPNTVSKQAYVASSDGRYVQQHDGIEQPTWRAKEAASHSSVSSKSFSKLSRAMARLAERARNLLADDDERLRAARQTKWNKEMEKVRSRITSAPSFQPSTILERRGRPSLNVIPPTVIDGVPDRCRVKLCNSGPAKCPPRKSTEGHRLPGVVPSKVDKPCAGFTFKRMTSGDSLDSTSADSKDSRVDLASECDSNTETVSL